MINELTWKHFFVGIAFIAIIYYAIVILLFFRKDILQRLRGHGIPFQQSNPSELDEEDNLAQRFENRLDENQDTGSSESLSAQNDLMVGTVADLMQDIKALAHVIAQNESSIEETESFFRMLLSRYEQLAGTSYQQAINDSLLKLLGEEILLPVTVDEIESWWPNTLSSKN